VKHRLLNLLTALSLMLCLAAGVEWLRSYWVRDVVAFGRAGGHCHVAQSIRGGLHLLSNLDGGCSGGFTHASDPLDPNALWNGGMSSYPISTERHLGFVWQHYTRSRVVWDWPAHMVATRHRLVVVPWWSVTGLFAIAPAARLTVRLWRRRRRPGHCPRCGYDLRATPDRCPECGHVAAATATPSAGGR